MTKRAFTKPYVPGPAPAARHMNHQYSTSCAALAVLLLSLSVPAQTPEPRNDFVIRNARIFDGSRVIANADVRVRNGMIQAVDSDISVKPFSR